jgi:hypothetical protein
VAWTTQPYCMLSDVKALLDPNMGAQDDTFLSGLIIQAQSDLDSEIGYSFQQDGTVASPATRYYDGTGGYELWTDDIISLASTGGVIETITVTYLNPNFNAWVPGSTYTTDITADIILKPNNYASLGIPANKMVRNSGYHFAVGIQNYKVSGIFGRPILPNQTYPGVPNDLSRACMRLVVHYYKMRDAAYADMVQEQGSIRIHYTKDWPADVKRVVAKYQHTRFLTRIR